MTGNTTSPGKNWAAITAPAEMLRIPTPKVMVTNVDVFTRSSFARPMPNVKPNEANRQM